MKIMFIIPRYHTNQTEWINGLIINGNEVDLLVQYKGLTESYENIEPSLVPESAISRLRRTCIEKSKLPDNIKTNKKMTIFTPSLSKLYGRINKFKPDIIIVRDRTKLSAYSYIICKVLKIDCILYNQIPYMLNKDKSLIKRVMNFLFFPKYRMTPVRNTKIDDDNIKAKNDFYIPFAVRFIEDRSRQYFKNNRINILTIGKFYERKNHLLLINVINKLKDYYKVHLTIVGEVSNNTNSNYLHKVKDLISKLNVEEYVSIETNIPYEKMSEVFMDNDIYVLPSTNEQAAVSHLEAMAHGLLAICSKSNGTASYIKDGYTGYVFKDNDFDDLYEKLDVLCKNKNLIPLLGKNAINHVENNHSSNSIYKKFENMFNTIKG